MIALPVISSIVAPNAVMAASCSFPGLPAPGDFWTWINQPIFFCDDSGDFCNPPFWQIVGYHFAVPAQENLMIIGLIMGVLHIALVIMCKDNNILNL